MLLEKMRLYEQGVAYVSGDLEKVGISLEGISVLVVNLMIDR